MHMGRTVAVTCTALLLGSFPASAWAYIDPNAGGLLFQLLAPVLAAVVGCWVFLRNWIADCLRRVWRRLRREGQ
jgi:hypothetical protein